MPTTTSATSSTTFSGLASGIDSAALIKSMVATASQPITRLSKQQNTNLQISSKFTDFKTKLTALQTAAQAMDTRREAMINKPTSADANVLTVSSAGGASLGTFEVTVTSSAKAERTYSNPVTDGDQAGVAGAGQLSIQIGAGTAATIDISTEDSLYGVVKKINAGNLGVTAGIVFDGSKYRIQVAGNEAGADHAITFSGDAADALGLSDPANQFQAATDAVVSIDGITVNSRTNSITSAIPGVTLNIVAAGTTSVTIERDPDGLKTKVDAFVKAYNDVMTSMNGEFAYTGLAKTANSLSGDSTLRGVQSNLRSAMSQSLTGLTNSFGSIGELGVSVQRDGTLSVDALKLTAAVNKDYEGVSAVFAGNGTAKGLMSQLVDRLTPFTSADGSLQTRITNLATRNRDMDAQKARIQVRMDLYQTQLTNQYAALESLMSDLQGQGASLTAIMKNF